MGPQGKDVRVVQKIEDRSGVSVEAMTFIGICAGKARQDRMHSLGLSSLNNFGGLGAMRVWP